MTNQQTIKHIELWLTMYFNICQACACGTFVMIFLHASAAKSKSRYLRNSGEGVAIQQMLQRAVVPT